MDKEGVTKAMLQKNMPVTALVPTDTVRPVGQSVRGMNSTGSSSSSQLASAAMQQVSADSSSSSSSSSSSCASVQQQAKRDASAAGKSEHAKQPYSVWHSVYLRYHSSRLSLHDM
jgi:hypothetical protein